MTTKYLSIIENALYNEFISLEGKEEFNQEEIESKKEQLGKLGIAIAVLDAKYGEILSRFKCDAETKMSASANIIRPE